jgi:hypothetical protein
MNNVIQVTNIRVGNWNFQASDTELLRILN